MGALREAQAQEMPAPIVGVDAARRASQFDSAQSITHTCGGSLHRWPASAVESKFCAADEYIVGLQQAACRGEVELRRNWKKAPRSKISSDLIRRSRRQREGEEA